MQHLFVIVNMAAFVREKSVLTRFNFPGYFLVGVGRVATRPAGGYIRWWKGWGAGEL